MMFAKVRFANFTASDVGLRPMMTASPNDVWLTALWASIASLRPKGDISQCLIARYFTFAVFATTNQKIILFKKSNFQSILLDRWQKKSVY